MKKVAINDFIANAFILINCDCCRKSCQGESSMSHSRSLSHSINDALSGLKIPEKDAVRLGFIKNGKHIPLKTIPDCPEKRVILREGGCPGPLLEDKK